MNKNVLALAVAAIVGGMPVLASANATISGVLGYRIDVINGKVATARTHDLAVRGSEDLGNGLTGLYQFALTGGTSVSTDVNFVGLRGGFGTVLMGKLDHPYRTAGNGYRLFGDTIATGSFGRPASAAGPADRPDANRTLQSAQRIQSEGAIAYVSPSFSGVSFSAAVVPQTSSPADATNDGTSRKNETPYSLTVSFSQGPIFLNAAYEDVKGAGGALGTKATMIGGRYTIGDLMLGVMGEEIKTNPPVGGTSEKLTRIIVPVSYKISPSTTLLASVMRQDLDQAALGADVRDTTDWAIGVNYALSSRTSIKAAYAHSAKVVDGVAADNGQYLINDRKDASGFSVFVRHAF
jgi:predicted porin